MKIILANALEDIRKGLVMRDVWVALAREDIDDWSSALKVVHQLG